MRFRNVQRRVPCPAAINTVAVRAQDAFYIVDAEGQKIASHEELDRIQQYLLDGLAS